MLLVLALVALVLASGVHGLVVVMLALLLLLAVAVRVRVCACGGVGVGAIRRNLLFDPGLPLPPLLGERGDRLAFSCGGPHILVPGIPSRSLRFEEQAELPLRDRIPVVPSFDGAPILQPSEPPGA